MYDMETRHGCCEAPQSGALIARYVAVSTGLAEMSPVASAALSPKDGADKGACRAVAGVAAPHRAHFEPPPHLPVFSGPVWTQLIVITGKFHQTVISGPL